MKSIEELINDHAVEVQFQIAFEVHVGEIVFPNREALIAFVNAAIRQFPEGV